MRATFWGLALATIAAAGCTTEERVLPRGTRLVHEDDGGDDAETRPGAEATLLARVEEDPKDTRAWWQLGEYYEKMGAYDEALRAYMEMKTLIDAEGQAQGKKYTAGDYHLGRVFTKARDFLRAIHYLEKVLETQPQEVSFASLNRHYREAHYLLGAIYYETRQWDLSKKHFVSFRELGGEPERVEPWLAKIDEVTWAGEARAGRGRRPGGAAPGGPSPVPGAAPPSADPPPPAPTGDGE